MEQKPPPLHERKASLYNHGLEAIQRSSDQSLSTPNSHFPLREASTDSQTPSLPFRPRKFSSPLVSFPPFRVDDPGESKEEGTSLLVDSGFSSAFIDHTNSHKLCPKYHDEGLCELGPKCPLTHEKKQPKEPDFSLTLFNPSAPEFHPTLHYKVEKSPLSLWNGSSCSWDGGAYSWEVGACSWEGGSALNENNFVMSDLTNSTLKTRRRIPEWKHYPTDSIKELSSSSNCELASSVEERKDPRACPYRERCFFYHKIEERSTSKTKLKTRLCKSWNANGHCPYGERCDFAHGCDELNIKFKTRMCKVYLATGRCPYGEQCTFAHNLDERRPDISTVYKFKTELCQLWKRGNCSYGPVCHFAHGAHELRLNGDFSM